MNKEILLAWTAAILLSLAFWLSIYLVISEVVRHV